MNDNRYVKFVQNYVWTEIKEPRSRKRLGFFGWLGLLMWTCVALVTCTHMARAQPLPAGYWMVMCSKNNCVPYARKSGGMHIFQTMSACETDRAGTITRDAPAGIEIKCQPTATALPPTVYMPTPSPSTTMPRTTTCRWIGVNFTCE